MLPFLRSAFNYDMDAASDRTGLTCDDPSLAVQSSRDEVDINTIVRRFGLTGQLPAEVSIPQYGDFSEVVDFHSAMNLVSQAREGFDRMPPQVRARFSNDPGVFVDFCSDPDNADELVKLGLRIPPIIQEVKPIKVEVIPTMSEVLDSVKDLPQTKPA